MEEQTVESVFRHRRARIGGQFLLAAAALAIAAAFVLGTPFALLAIGHIDPKDWAQLSNEGQAYGGIAAVFGMLALAGVAVSLIMQSRESIANRESLNRTLHNDLLYRAIDDEVLRSCWGPHSFQDSDEERQQIYTNLIFSFWRSMFEVGKLSEHDLRDAARNIFGGAPGRRYWSFARPHQMEYHTVSRRDVAFVQIVEQEYAAAMVREPKPAVSGVRSKGTHRVSGDRSSIITALIFGAAGGAITSVLTGKARIASRSYRLSRRTP